MSATFQEVEAALTILRESIGTTLHVQGRKYDIMIDITKILKEKGYVVSKEDCGVMFA